MRLPIVPMVGCDALVELKAILQAAPQPGGDDVLRSWPYAGHLPMENSPVSLRLWGSGPVTSARPTHSDGYDVDPTSSARR